MDDATSQAARTKQADAAGALAELLRHHGLPAIGWYIASDEARVEGQLYRESETAVRAGLAAFADVLGVEITESQHEDDSGTTWVQPAVESRYKGVQVAILGPVHTGSVP